MKSRSPLIAPASLILALLLPTCTLIAQGAASSIEKSTKVHRLNSEQRAPFDAFVYVNRIPESAKKEESPTDFAGRIYGRLANQEGRILLKLPPGMDRKAYLGYKTFLGSEGDEQVSNCVSCHSPGAFTDLKSHVTAKGTKARPTPSLRNLKARNIDLENVIRAKIKASEQKRSGAADEIDDAYKTMTVTEQDIPNLIAFLNSINDVPDAQFRDLIIKAKVTDTSVENDQESTSPAVFGQVRFKGPRPDAKWLGMDKPSLKLHKSRPKDEFALIGPEGELANVFIQVKKGLEKKNYDPPKDAALMDQIGSIFRPRVQGVMVGQEFIMRNSDPFIHNVRSLSLKNRAFNVAQPPKTKDRKKIFKRAEGPIRMGCDFHRWMKAFVFVVDHPYFAVTDAQGRFKIEGLPPGTYTLEAWHEEFGKQRIELEVGIGPNELNFTFTPKK